MRQKPRNSTLQSVARTLLLAATLCGPLCGVGPAAPAAQDGEAPPSQALLRGFASFTRLAGTSGSQRGAEYVTEVLEAAGWTVEWDEREVLLSHPRRTQLEIYPDPARVTPAVQRVRSFDPDRVPAGDVPPFSAWSADGDLRAPVVDAGYGTREDFERLKQARVELAGAIALCRYGKGYRGVKVALAQAHGCVGVLLFSDPADDGAGKGDTWPAGPWKPAHDVQRGSISPMADAPGDPSTPGFPSPAVGEAPGRERLSGDALTARLPRIPCLPVGADDAARILEALRVRRVTDEAGERVSVPMGPGPVEVRLAVDAPRTVRRVINVVARLEGRRPTFVLAGNHRDAWVRGAHDAGSGTVALLRAAQRLGERVRAGWQPEHGLALAFWDAEELGLIGSTEWAEAHAGELRDSLVAYVNADAAVSGTTFGCSGTPGLEPLLARALARLPHPEGGTRADGGERTLLDQWLASGEGLPRLDLPGSGSDFTVFLHHLGLPVLDLAFRGNSGGQYHTAFDDVEQVERHLDPGYAGHELAGAFVEELLVELATLGALGFQDEYATRELARHAREAEAWLGTERAEALAIAFETLGRSINRSWKAWGDRMEFHPTLEFGPFGTWPSFLTALQSADVAVRADALRNVQGRSRIYQALELPEGLPGRPWYKNRLWAPAVDQGYGSETFPGLRAAAGNEVELQRRVDALLEALNELRSSWDEEG